MSVIQNIKFLNAFNKFTQKVGKEPMSWLPSLITLLASATAIFSPQIQHYITAHPESAATIAGIYAIIKGILPSPIK